jgi:cytochrome c-type biogenesis protein
MEISNVSMFMAFGAGILSLISPCVLPLVPAYLSYLGGRVATAREEARSRRATFLHGIFFVLGFSAIFVALGAAASGVGQALYTYRSVLMKVGGAVAILFGLHTLGLIKIPFLYYDTRRQYHPRPELGYLSSALMGFFFGAGWSPCMGPTLGAILTLALNEATVGRGALLLFTYSMGLGAPFLLVALGVDRAADILHRARRAMRVVTVVSGLFLIALGILLFTNSLSWLAQWVPPLELAVTADSSQVAAANATPKVGFAAPDFTLETLDGEMVTLSDLRRQVLVINLWATWCIPCRAEMPALEQVWNDFRDQGLVVLTVNQGESAARVGAFVDDQGWALPVLLDPDSTLSTLYQLRGYPTTFFIDRDGIIQEVVFGGEMDEPTIAGKVSALLEE